MEENYLNINTIKEGNKNLIGLKIKKVPTFDKLLLIPFAIGIIIFIFFTFVLFTSLPLFFKIGIPLMLVIGFILIYLSGSQIKNMALVLSKQGNKLYIRKVFSKSKITEKTINLQPNAKLVLMKFIPLTTLGRSQLFLKNGDKFEVMVPVEWDVIAKFPFINPHMKKFLYTENDAKQLAKLINMPLEISNKDFSKYFSEIKK